MDGTTIAVDQFQNNQADMYESLGSHFITGAELYAAFGGGCGYCEIW